MADTIKNSKCLCASGRRTSKFSRYFRDAAVAVAARRNSGHEGKGYVITGTEALSNRHKATSILSQVLGRDNQLMFRKDTARQGMQGAYARFNG